MTLGEVWQDDAAGGVEPVSSELQRSIDELRQISLSIDSGPTDARRVDIAGVVVEFRFSGSSLQPRLWPAIAHHPRTSAAPHSVLHLWAADETGSPLARYPPEAMDGGVTARGRTSTPPPQRLQYQPGLRALVGYDRRTGEAWFEAASASELPWWETGAPLRGLLGWILADHGRLLVHGGAIGDSEGALLLVGRGGSGKSTTTLAAAAAGYGYLGDDYCVLHPGDSPSVHSLYATAKVDWGTLAAFPRLRSQTLNPNAEGEKALVMPAAAVPNVLVRRARLAAIVAPRISSRAEAHAAPIGPAEALTALAPSTILQLPGAGGPYLSAFAQVLRVVPAYRLLLGRDRLSVLSALTQIRSSVA